jgi:isocitrate lyase
VHYVTPTDDNQYQALKMKTHGIFSEVNIVADVDQARIAAPLQAGRELLGKLIRKEA